MTYLVTFDIYACGHLPMSGAVTFVQYDCEELPTGSSDHVWHHPSVACRYFHLIKYFGASRVPRVTHRGRSLVTPAGNTVQYKEEICVHSWRMVSNMVRCTRWKVLSIILDKLAHYTWRYSTCWVSKWYMTYWVIFDIYACGHLPMSSAVTFVQYDCEDLPTGSSDHVWHHPLVACRYFPLIKYFGASRVSRVTHRGRSLVTPAGNTVQYKEEICVHS